MSLNFIMISWCGVQNVKDKSWIFYKLSFKKLHANSAMN